MFNEYTNNKKNTDTLNYITTSDEYNKFTMQLHSEILDISKKPLQTGDVKIHKEVLIEEKTITVPITREVLVVEKTVFNSEFGDKTEKQTEVIRIPISEEHVDVNKYKVELEDISVYKNQFQEIKHVQETLKKEIVHIKTTGNAKVIDKK